MQSDVWWQMETLFRHYVNQNTLTVHFIRNTCARCNHAISQPSFKWQQYNVDNFFSTWLSLVAARLSGLSISEIVDLLGFLCTKVSTQFYTVNSNSVGRNASLLRQVTLEGQRFSAVTKTMATQVTTLYIHGEQKNMTKCITCQAEDHRVSSHEQESEAVVSSVSTKLYRTA